MRQPTSRTARGARTALATIAAVALTGSLAAAPSAAAATDTSSARGHRAAVLPVLRGTVGPGFTITLDQSSVPAGRYKLIVKDQGTIHNFHILGEGVDKATSIPETGKTKWRIRLREGTYTIQCDAHVATMNTTLTVTP